MNKVIYSTKEECLKAIATIEALGYEAASWMIDQLKTFEETEQSTQTTNESDTPIWDTLKANYPYGTMPQEKIDCVESTVKQLLEEGKHAEEPDCCWVRFSVVKPTHLKI